MTYEEALAIFKDHEYWADISIIDDACNVAIEAIEKQIPKKVARKKYFSECPNCACNFVDCGMPEFCEYCGQALDWSGEK